MSWLSDDAIRRLRGAGGDPGLAGPRYRIQAELGRGGMGTVYRARDLELDRDVALKVAAAHALEADAANALLREARVLARLEHPGIVPVHDAGLLPDGRPYCAMKLVDGERLDRAVTEGTTTLERLRLFARIADAVAFAHDRGALHRDLKPANVMVGAFGEVLVLDWGVAKALSASVGGDGEPAARGVDGAHGGTRQGTVVGTPGWMAPEQARGDAAAVDERADVWGLGALLHWLLTGSAPALDAEREERPAALPHALWAVRTRALATEPEQRYPSASALARDVRAFLAREPVDAFPEGPLARARRFLARHSVVVSLLLAYAAVRALAFFLQADKGSG